MARTIQAKKFINCLMSGGERKPAERIFGTALDKVRRSIVGTASLGQILNGAIENARPFIVIQRRQVGDVKYDIPVAISEKRNRAIAIRTIIDRARGLPGHGMASRLAKEILAAYRDKE